MKLSRADKIKAEELAEKYGIPLEEVKKIIVAPYDFIRKTTSKLEFPDGLSKEEFDKMKTNFMIPALAKMHASYFLYNEIQKKKNKK